MPRQKGAIGNVATAVEADTTDLGAVHIKQEPVDVESTADESSSAEYVKIEVMDTSDLRNPPIETGNLPVTMARNTVEKNVSRKSKLGTMQAIYKSLKRVDEEEEEEEAIGDCSEDEDGALTDNEQDEEQTGHFLVGDSLGEMDELLGELSAKRGKFDDSSWSTVPVSKNAKSPSWFSVTQYPKFTGDPTSFASEASFFSLLLDDVLVDGIVTNTNEEIKRKSTDDWRLPVGTVSAIEIRAVFGLLLMYGLLRRTPLSPSDMFSDCYGPPMFKCTLTRNKLEFILRAMSFDQKKTRQERKQCDKFAAYRDFWNVFCDNCAKWYSPSEYLTVGESLLGFRGKCPFKISANQKIRYAMKLISLCDARTFYFCGGIPHLGKDFQSPDHLRLPTQYVVELTEQIRGFERNITMGDWFSSIELADELKKRNFTMVGAIKKTEYEIPSNLLSSKPFLEPQFAYQEDKTLVAFNLNYKNSLFLSTLHKNGACNQQNGKPDIYELYEMTRSGLDVIDRNCELYSSRRTSSRWSMRFFFRTLDLAAHNSYILYQLATNTTCRRVDFIKRLALTLAEPLMQQRMYNTALPKILRQNVCQVLGIEPRKVVMELAKSAAASTKSPCSARRRCWFCDSKKDRKTTRYCTHCDLPICAQHTVSVLQCQLCASETNEADGDIVVE